MPSLAQTLANARLRVWRSVFRHGFTSSNRNRSLIVLSNFFLHFHPVKARARAMRFTRTFYLGGLSAACFFILTLSGTFLMFYYRPAVPQAYHDMKDLAFVVPSGTFLRNLHRWTAHVMIALVLLHMAWTFLRGAYRPPREFNWVIGVGLFVVSVLLSYTGYLLPWDQLAYWAVTVGTNMVAVTPLVGHELRLLLLGGHAINDNALLRFYVLHCVLLPMVLAIGVGLHVWRVRKDGGIYLPREARDHDHPHGPTEAPVPPAALATPAHIVIVDDGAPDLVADLGDEPMLMTFPHLLVRELVAFLALSLCLVLISLRFDAPLAALADPSRTPNPAKAPWYFVGVQELLQYYPPVVAGVVLPSLLVVALAIVPYFQVNVERPPVWQTAPFRRLALLWLGIVALSWVFCFTGARPVWAIVVPLWLVGVTMSVGALPWPSGPFGVWLRTRSLPFWIFVWFLLSAATLTATGFFFRGPSWSFTIPWRDGIY